MLENVIGPMPDIGLEVLAMERKKPLGKSVLTVRFDCCDRIGSLQYEGLRKKISRYKRQRATGETPTKLCELCTRRYNASAMYRRALTVKRQQLPDYFPIIDARLGECVNHDTWPTP